VTVDIDVRELYGPLREQALARVDLALNVAVMARAHITRADMATRLGVSPGEIRRAVADLQAIVGEIELGGPAGRRVAGATRAHSVPELANPLGRAGAGSTATGIRTRTQFARKPCKSCAHALG
jgi:hypothetical protein